MKATQGDRAFPQANQKKSKFWLLIPIVAICIIIAGYLLMGDTPEPIKIPQPITQTPTGKPAALPEIPVITVEEPGFLLPILDKSDGEFRTHIIEISDELAPWLQAEELIRRSVSFIEGLSKGQVLTKLMSLPPPTGAFLVTKTDEGVFLSPENYQRYDLIAKLITALDQNKITTLFHTFRPLFEQAYGEIGYQTDSFDAAVIFTLNEIIATPSFDQALKLKQESVHYTYANSKIENLSNLQKQLLRMGPEITKVLQDKALILKNGLLTTQDTTENTLIEDVEQ